MKMKLKKYADGTKGIVKKQSMMSEEEEMVDPVTPGESNNQRSKRMSAEADQMAKETYTPVKPQIQAKQKMTYQDAAAKIKSDKSLLAEFKKKKAETPKGKEFTITIGGQTFRYAGVTESASKAEQPKEARVTQSGGMKTGGEAKDSKQAGDSYQGDTRPTTQLRSPREVAERDAEVDRNYVTPKMNVKANTSKEDEERFKTKLKASMK